MDMNIAVSIESLW